MSTTHSRRSNGGRPPSSKPGLTPREKVVAGLVCEGLSNNEIAAAMTVSRKSVDNYMRALYGYYGLVDCEGGKSGKRVKLVLRISGDRQLSSLFGEDY